MNNWDTISAHNQHFNDEMRRREKVYLAEADRNLQAEEHPNPLATLTEALRQRLSNTQTNQSTAPQAHGPETAQI